jgi:hypothetical protein
LIRKRLGRLGASGTLTQAERDNAYEDAVLYNVSVQIVNENNDGIVLQSSANGLSGLNVLNLEMELQPNMGVNHQECMNHRFVTDKFETIFNGTIDTPNDDIKTFFRIPLR